MSICALLIFLSNAYWVFNRLKESELDALSVFQTEANLSSALVQKQEAEKHPCKLSNRQTSQCQEAEKHPRVIAALISESQLSSQDDNCQHTRFWFHNDAMVSIYPLECRWKQFMNFVIIVGTDPFALKQSKRVKLLQGSFVLFVCENFQYVIPNPTDGSMFIALEGTQRLSRGHVHHFAIKTYCRHIITVRHLTRITGSPRRN